MGAYLIAMFSSVEILAVFLIGLLWVAGVALAVWLVYVLVRRAARDGARDAQRDRAGEANPTSKT